MAKRSKTSPIKRQREAEKRERQARRAAKTALKRERKLNREETGPEIVIDQPLTDQVPDQSVESTVPRPDVSL